MDSFWSGFEKRAGKKQIAQGFLNTLKGSASSAIKGVGGAMDSAGGWLSAQAKSLNKTLPANVRNFNNRAVNTIKANPVKSAIGAAGVAYGAGRMTAPTQQPQPQVYY